ncbi:MAG: histidine phosphatase family protein [Pseudomonadota bacterium]
MMTTIVWLRHAPTNMQAMIGRRDLAAVKPPDAQCQRITRRIRQHFGNQNPMTCLYSTRIRTRQTLDWLNLDQVLIDTQIHPFLDEQNFGRLEGYDYAQLQKNDPELAASMASNMAAFQPPGGESFKALCHRVDRGLVTWLGGAPNRNVLIVAHAGTIRAGLRLALGITASAALRFVIEPLSMTVIHCMIKPKQTPVWRVCSVNDVVPSYEGNSIS